MDDFTKRNPYFAYISVLSNDNYLPGIIALVSSFRNVKSKYRLYVLCSNEVSTVVIDQIRKLDVGIIRGEAVIFDQSILSDNVGDYQKWNNTFLKLRIASLVQFKKIVFIDADMLLMRNVDNLFSCPHMSCVSAGKALRGKEAEGINSGLLVIEPSTELFETLCQNIINTKIRLGSKPMGDQDVFQTVYPTWSEKSELQLPEIYNCYNTDIDELTERRILRFQDIAVIHFAMVKPWNVNKYLYPIQVLHAQRVLHGNYRCKYHIATYLQWWKYYKLGICRMKGKKNGTKL